ncbi:phage integrase N-terminal SAM-like domain-containing protein [bacterium]|nr:phage integrase N-terminal SAM-like domain-containing protein [bacterium]
MAVLQCELSWIRNYIYFHDKQHPTELNEQHVGDFLTHLAMNRKVAAPTQNQALYALVFLYKHVLWPPYYMVQVLDSANACGCALKISTLIIGR